MMKRRLLTIPLFVLTATTIAVAQSTAPVEPSKAASSVAAATTEPITVQSEDIAAVKAEDAAFRDALDALRRDVLQAPFSNELTIGQAARKLGVADDVEAATKSARQPGGLRWRNNTCELRLELPGNEVANVLAKAGKSQSDVLGMSRQAFDRRISHLQTQRFIAIGFGRDKAASVPTVAAIADPVGGGVDRPAKLIPLDPPAWVSQQLDVEGQGSGIGLKGARAAEAVALAQLREQISALSLTPGITLGQASDRDPRVNQAISNAMRRARVSRVDYGADAVTVRISLDLDFV